MWKDKILYWEWSGKRPKKLRRPPSVKKIIYANLSWFCSNSNQVKMRLAVAVLDITDLGDEKKTEINRDELEWFRALGVKIEICEAVQRKYQIFIK